MQQEWAEPMQEQSSVDGKDENFSIDAVTKSWR
jgi:hypothetical protein